MGAQHEIKPAAIAKFDPGKTYVVRGDLLNQLAMAALPIRAGKGLREVATPKGKIFDVIAMAEGGIADCALGSVFLDEAEDSFLRGGVVMGGESNEVIAPIALNLLAADGTWLWLEVNFTANVEDDVLLPGVESISSVSTGSGTTIPANVLPTNGPPTGKIHIPLGSYLAGAFFPSACGNATINHCPGTISFTRA